MTEKTFKIPEFGTKTCVVGSEWKEGEFNGKKFAFQTIYGISLKTINQGREQIIVSESFKLHIRVNVQCGDVVSLVFDRYGKVDSVIKA